MRHLFWLSIALAFTLATTSPVQAQNNAAANKLFVEAIRLVQKADAEMKPEEQVRLYEQVLKNLDEIVAKYPGSDLTIKLLTGQSIGDFSKAGVQNKLKNDKCLLKPALCFLATALAVTKLIPDADDKVDPFNAIATAYAKMGETGKAKEYLAKAMKIIPSVNVKFRVWNFESVAKVQIEIGDIPGATEAAKKIMDLPYKISGIRYQKNAKQVGYNTYARIAEAQAKAGDFQGAIKTTEKIASDIWRNNSLMKLGRKLIKAKNFSYALSTFEKITNKSISLPLMAEAYFGNGKIKESRAAIKEAIEITANFKQTHDKDSAFAFISISENIMGNAQKAKINITHALELINQTPNAVYRGTRKVRFAEMFMEYKLVSEVKKFLYLKRWTKSKI